MKRKTLIGAGLLAASATVTALSISGTLVFQPFGSGNFDTQALNGARLDLDVEPGPVQDDDDIGGRADSTLFDADEERRDLSITGGSLADGDYIDLALRQWSSITRLADVDRLSIGGSRYELGLPGLTLDLAGITLDFDPGTFVGPDALGELGLPGSLGAPSRPPAVLNAPPTNSDIAIKDENGAVIARYNLVDILVDTGDDSGTGGRSGNDGAGDGGGDQTGRGGDGEGQPGGGDGGTPMLAGFDPELGSPSQHQDPPAAAGGGGGGGSNGPTAHTAQVPLAPTAWLLLPGVALFGRRRG